MRVKANFIYRFLPSAIGRVTGVRIFIGHDPNVHDGPCKHSNGCDVSKFTQLKLNSISF